MLKQLMDLSIWGVIWGYFFKPNPIGRSNQLFTVQISWLRQKSHCNFWSSGWIFMFKGSFWDSFSRPIQLWGQISCLLYKSAELKIKITVTFDPKDGFWCSKGHFGVFFQAKSLVHTCTHLYTLVHACTHLYTLVNTCTHLYTLVHSCTLLYTLVHSCTPLYTLVHPCTRVYFFKPNLLYTLVQECYNGIGW